MFLKTHSNREKKTPHISRSYVTLNNNNLTRLRHHCRYLLHPQLVLLSPSHQILQSSWLSCNSGVVLSLLFHYNSEPTNMHNHWNLVRPLWQPPQMVRSTKILYACLLTHIVSTTLINGESQVEQSCQPSSAKGDAVNRDGRLAESATCHKYIKRRISRDNDRTIL